MEQYITDFTVIMRNADEIFHTSGGSTRHYVRDVLFPLLEKNGFILSKPATQPPSAPAENKAGWLPSMHWPEEGVVSAPAVEEGTFQERVKPFMTTCFGDV